MLLEIKDVSKTFGAKPVVQALDGVSLCVEQGQNLGIVGESGSGKTTLARIIMGLLAADSGEVCIPGLAKDKSISSLVRMVFQDPFSSLDPRMKVFSILDEALWSGPRITRAQRKEKMARLMVDVGLDPQRLRDYPHEFSGGERQRIAIARALMSDPKLLILDEAVSALDVLVQQEIMGLLENIQTKRDITYIFISHDLRMVERIAHQVAVMYQGRLVEYAPMGDLINAPQHAYTRRLLKAARDYRADERSTIVLSPRSSWEQIGAQHWVLQEATC